MDEDKTNAISRGYNRWCPAYVRTGTSGHHKSGSADAHNFLWMVTYKLLTSSTDLTAGPPYHVEWVLDVARCGSV